MRAGMIRGLRGVLAALAVIVPAQAAGGDVAPVPREKPALSGPAPKPEAPLDRFGARIDRAFETGDFVGLAVAVVKDGRTAFLRTLGRRHAAEAAPVDGWTRFRIASLSKGFAASVAGQLALEGKLDLDMPVTRFAPDFRLARTGGGSPIKLEHVLSHRLGLPPFAYDNLLEAGVPLPRIFERLRRVRPLCRVGDCYTYQNVAFSLIEPAIEHAAGASYAETVSARLFEPLAMPRASIGQDGLVSDPNWARPHVRDGERGWREASLDTDYYRVASAGGVNASITDMVHWLKAQMGYAPQVLPKAVRELIHSPRIFTRGELRKIHWMRDRVGAAYYGLGWRIYDYAGRKVVMHNGGLEGYRAQIAFMPEADLGVVALWNSQGDRGWAIMPTLFDAWLGLEDPDWLRLDCVGWHNDPAYCPQS